MILIPWLRIVGQALGGCQVRDRNKVEAPSTFVLAPLLTVAKNSLTIEAFRKVPLISRHNQFQRKGLNERENLDRRDM